MQRADPNSLRLNAKTIDSRELRELLDRLPPDDASALRAHIRMIATESMRQGMTMAASLLMANLEHRVDINSLARHLPSMPLLGAD